jgi:hypothetical protein
MATEIGVGCPTVPASASLSCCTIMNLAGYSLVGGQARFIACVQRLHTLQLSVGAAE